MLVTLTKISKSGMATTGLHLAQFRQPHRPLAKAVDYADLFIYDEAQQEAALSDLAILGALPRKCLVLRLGDPKQTSGGTGPSDLGRRVRAVSDQLALGIRAPRKPYLPQALPALIQSLLQDDLPHACCPDSRSDAMVEQDCEVDADGALPSGRKPSTDDLMAGRCEDADVDGAPPSGGKPPTDALLSAESARLPLAVVLLQVTGDAPLRWHTAGDLDACAGERVPHDWSIMLPVSQRVQPGVYTLMALSRYRDALVQWDGPERPLVYQPLVPRILTTCYQVVLLPPRDFGELPPVARDIYYAVALFLQVRAEHPDLIEKHRGPGSLLLTPRLDTQGTFAKLFADIGIDGDVRYARIEDLLRHGPPAPASITARHVQALRADLRAETLSHAAGLTSHTTLLVFGKSGFIGTDEAGHGRSTVGLTRARGITILLLSPPDPYGLTGLVQTTYAYYFSVHTAYWQLPDAPLPLSLGPQDVGDVLRPLDATSWAEVPLALQLHTPKGRTVGWYGTNQQGAFLQICHTTPKIRLRLPHYGNEEVLQDGYRLILLPKLAYYAMWDGHGESFAVPRATPKGAEASLPSGSYTSAPRGGTDAPDPSSALALDAREEPEVTSAESLELQQLDGQPNPVWQKPDVRDFAPDAQAGATSTGHEPKSPCSISSDSRSSSLGATVPLPPHAADAGAAQSDAPCVSVIAPGSPGGASSGWNQDHVVAHGAVLNAPMDTSQEVDPASDDASEASEASVTTANSSCCDPQSPDDVPVISPPDLAAVLAAQDVTDVLLPDITAPLVTISIEERALAPAAPLLRVPYLERLLEAVRDGTPLDRLPDALRPAVIQARDDLATYITEIVLAMFDGDQLRSLPDQLQSFRSLADPLTVRRAVLTQMRYVADEASSLPSKAYSTSGRSLSVGVASMQGAGTYTQAPHSFPLCPAAGGGLPSDSSVAAARSLPVSCSLSNTPVRVVTLLPNGSSTWRTRPRRHLLGGT